MYNWRFLVLTKDIEAKLFELQLARLPRDWWRDAILMSLQLQQD